MACDIIINTEKLKMDFNGSELNQDNEPLFNQEGFDTWLRENLNEIRKQLGDYEKSNYNPTFALDLTEINKRISKFETFKTELEKATSKIRSGSTLSAVSGDTENTGLTNIITVGVTPTFSKVGKSPDEINKPVAEHGDIREEIRSSEIKAGSSQETINQKLADYDRLDFLRKLDGQIFGALIQDKLTNSTKDLNALKTKTKEKDLKKYGLTWDQAVARITKYGSEAIDDIVSKIKAKFPKYKEVHTEFRLVSKSVYPKLLEALNAAYAGSTNAGKITQIEGYIDIIILDAVGNPHTVDIKLSTISVKNYWGNSNWKYNEMSAQQMAYYSMGRQWDMRFTSVNIAPANIKYDSKGDILDKIVAEDIKTFDSTNPYASICATYFHYDEEAGAEVVQSSCEDMDQLFPGLKLVDKLNTKQYTLDWFERKYKKKKNNKYTIDVDSRFPADDYGYKVSKIGKISFDTWQEAEKFLREHYIPTMNEIFARDNIALVEDLNKIATKNISIENKIKRLEEVAGNIAKNNTKTKQFIVNTFKKYVCDGWEIIHDKTGDFANYGILLFVKNNIIEIVMLDNADLFAQYRLGKAENKNLLGNYLNDLSQGVDDIRVLPAYRGNLLAMQAMALIARNKNGVFTGRTVQAIRTVNLNFREELTQFNDRLRENWNSLVFHYNQANPDKNKFKTIGESALMSGILALVNRANDISRLYLDERVNFIGHEEHIKNFTDDAADEIFRYIRNLTAHYQINSKEDWAKHTDAFEAFTLLSQALLAARGFTVTMENDIGDYFEGIFLNGGKIIAPAESPSANVRMLSRIESVYEKKVSDIYEEITTPFQLALIEALEESGYDNFFSNERNLFKLCFERDDDGNITEEFILLPPDKNKDIADKPKLQKLVTIFLETINEYRIPDEEDRARLKDEPGSLYYQVPLTETTTIQEIKNTKNPFTVIKRKAANIFTETKDYLFGDTLSNWELKQYDDISKERIYNSYLDTSEEAQELRGRKLSGEAIGFDEDDKHQKRFGVNAFETSLDVIFLRTMAATVRSIVSTEYMPLFVGLRAFIAFNANVTGANMDTIEKTVEDFIKSNVFHKRIIDPSETTIYNILGVLRSITSILALAGNTVTLTREMVTSWIRTAVNLENDPLMKDAFDLGDYSTFMLDITKEAPKNVDLHSFYAQINYRYRMANMTEAELPGRRKTNKWNINNWEEDVLFLNTTTGDFVHRNAIVCAVLKKRGAFDALYKDKDGILQYDPKKDKQYEIYFKYKDTAENEIPASEKQKFIDQRKFYNIAREDWNKTYGLNIQPGEYLPDALSPTEMESIRTYADHLFGNFDSDKKSTIQKTLLGSFVLQFKTFTLQQLMQNVRAKGYTNVIRSWHRMTTDGKKVYWVKCTTAEEIEEHGTGGYFVTEDQLDGIPLDKIEPVIDTAGGAVSSKMVNIVETGIDIISNPEAFKEKYSQSDVYKANVYMALIDNLGMLIIAALLKLLYGEDTIKGMKTEDWWTRWSYTVLMGVAQDGPINQVIGSLIGNGAPPSIAALQSFYQNAYEVITGEKPIVYGLLNTFGATRQFTGMVLGND